jgi:AcrR family transcriptional regulator
VARSKNPLTPNDYVVAAIKFVDERGLNSMTMRALGEEMGVDATALYRHFPNKESLIDAMIDWFLGQALALSHESDALPPRNRIIAHAKALRTLFEKYPDIGLSIVHSEGASMNGFLFSRHGIETLRELGLSGRDLVSCYQAIEGYIMGSCVHDFSGSPHNMEVRRTRYRYFEVPEFDENSRSVADVRKIAEEGFDISINAILDRFETLANKKPGTKDKNVARSSKTK